MSTLPAAVLPQRRTVKVPNPDHPIAMKVNPKRLVVRFNGRVVADSVRAITLWEADYAPVQYIPRDDIKLDLMVRSEHTSYCPYKGDASYYSLVSDQPEARDAVWSYEQPFFSVAQIKEHMAFYADRVELIELERDTSTSAA